MLKLIQVEQIPDVYQLFNDDSLIAVVYPQNSDCMPQLGHTMNVELLEAVIEVFNANILDGERC